jgi:hypothetical protein
MKKKHSKVLYHVHVAMVKTVKLLGLEEVVILINGQQ